MVPVDDQRVAMENRRASFAMAMLALHHSQVSFPDNRPLHVQAIDAAGSEKSENMLPIGYRGLGSEAGAVMASLMWKCFLERLFPESLSVLTVDREYHVLLLLGYRQIVMSPGRPAEARR